MYKKIPPKINTKKKNQKNNTNKQNINQMKIHHINCRGTIGKLEEIFQYIEENDPDMLCITESKLDEFSFG